MTEPGRVLVRENAAAQGKGKYRSPGAWTWTWGRTHDDGREVGVAGLPLGTTD
jgi:hypothetical protein